VGILARQQVHQQFVEVVTAKKGRACQQGLPALPFGLHQGQDFALARPAQFKGLERHQQAADRRARPARTACQQRHAPEIAGKHFDDETGFPERVRMQDVSRLAIDFAAQVHS